MSRHMGRPGASGHALVAPHHIVDVAAAFARVKYENFVSRNGAAGWVCDTHWAPVVECVVSVRVTGIGDR